MDRIRMFRYNTNDDGDKDDGVKMMMVILIVIAVWFVDLIRRNTADESTLKSEQKYFIKFESESVTDKMLSKR